MSKHPPGSVRIDETATNIRDRIVGTWKLVSTEETMNHGTTRPFPGFGPRAQGFLMYQADGYMCALLINPDRQKRTDAAGATVEEKAASRWRVRLWSL